MLLLAVLFAPACSVGPSYERPESVVEHMHEFHNTGSNAERTQKISMSQWWLQLDDSLLETLVPKLLKKNYNLRQARTRIVQAQAQLESANAALYPSLALNGGALRAELADSSQLSRSVHAQFAPTNESPGSGSALGTPGRASTLFEYTVRSSWQLDLFGRRRSAADAARAHFLAQHAMRDALRHSLIAELARQRVMLDATQKQLDLVEAIRANHEQMLAITRGRYRQGANNASLSNVRLAQVELASTSARLKRLTRRAADHTYAIDVLLGQQPGTLYEMLERRAKRVKLLPPTKLSLPVPAALLDRRPDLRSAELRLIAATNNVGVAIADLFPRLTLDSQIGASTSDLSDLFDASQVGWSLFGSIHQIIFSAGELRSAIKREAAEADELTHAYAATVLEAVQEVESGLQHAKTLRHERQDLQAAARHAAQAFSLERNNYQQGNTSLIKVLEQEQRWNRARSDLVELEGKRWIARIDLYLALGGDWGAAPPTTQSASSVEEQKSL